jgi:hypothetical protein
MQNRFGLERRGRGKGRGGEGQEGINDPNNVYTCE